MSLFRLTSAAILSALLSLGSAAASPWDTWTTYDTIYQRGNWALDINNYSDGTIACESRTTNNSDYWFKILTISTGDYVIQFENDGWDFGDQNQSQPFVVEIDRRGPWDIPGFKQGKAIFVKVTPPSDGLSRFFNEVARGNTLYLRNDRGNEIARFSLRGTSATLNQHRACERRIFSGFRSNDPFN